MNVLRVTEYLGRRHKLFQSQQVVAVCGCQVRLLADSDACVSLKQREVAPVVKVEDEVNVRTKGLAIKLVSIVLQQNIVFDDLINFKAHLNLFIFILQLKKLAKFLAFVSEIDETGECIPLQVG